MNELGWNQLKQRRQENRLILLHKGLNGYATILFLRTQVLVLLNLDKLFLFTSLVQKYRFLRNIPNNLFSLLVTSCTCWMICYEQLLVRRRINDIDNERIRLETTETTQTGK
jgi:hypothetical protein